MAMAKINPFFQFRLNSTIILDAIEIKYWRLLNFDTAPITNEYAMLMKDEREI